MGRLALNRDGRMMAILCDGRPFLPIGEERAYSSYCGNFQVEKNCLITTVDAAAVPERIGSEQVRRLEFRGNQLVLLPPRRADGSQRELFWEREAPA
jgi:Lipocalin-like domain